MTDIATEAGAAVEGIVKTGVQKAEQFAGSVLSSIAGGVTKEWNAAEAWIDGQAAKVQAALPASALPEFNAVVSDIKQTASDTLSLASTGAGIIAPMIAKGAENLADEALGAMSNGVALPLVPMTNAGIDQIASLGAAAFQSWALSAKAALASKPSA